MNARSVAQHHSGSKVRPDSQRDKKSSERKRERGRSMETQSEARDHQDQRRAQIAKRRQEDAYRSSPCRFWHQHRCGKGAQCKFSHVDEHGFDWHAEQWSSETAGPQMSFEKARPQPKSLPASAKPSGRAAGETQEPPWKRARSEASGSAGDGASTFRKEDQAPEPVGKASRPTNAMVYQWLHDERAVKDQKASLFDRDASRCNEFFAGCLLHMKRHG